MPICFLFFLYIDKTVEIPLIEDKVFTTGILQRYVLNVKPIIYDKNTTAWIYMYHGTEKPYKL